MEPEMLPALIAFLVGFWVYRDAKRRGKTTGKAFLWFLGVFSLLIVFLPLWFITRPRKEDGEDGDGKAGDDDPFKPPDPIAP